MYIYILYHTVSENNYFAKLRCQRNSDADFLFSRCYEKHRDYRSDSTPSNRAQRATLPKTQIQEVRAPGPLGPLRDLFRTWKVYILKE